LLQHRRDLDLSCVQLDGSHTPCKRGGAAVGYQGRKAAKTTNTIYLANNQGQMLCCQYFDEALYKRRYVIERANAWQDQFKALIIPYETRVDTWLNLLILSFTVIFIRRINKKNKS